MACFSFHHSFSMSKVKILSFCWFLLISFHQFSVFAQVRVPFTERSSQSNPARKTFNVKGDFALIGNTNLSLANYGDDLMNDNLLLYVDVDSDPNTINSSSATLAFQKENGADPSCTNVLFAGLYWSGRGPTVDVFQVSDQDGKDKRLSRKEITLSGPNGAGSKKFIAGDNDIRYTYGLDLDNDLGLFVGFVEVTDYVKTHGEGEYTVSDIGLLEGTNYHYGGWSLIVVYENPAMKNRDITVFDGYAFVRGSVIADYTIPVSGFSAINSGPVNIKLGVAAGEGDVAAIGDYFEIEKGVNSNDFVRLSHSGNSPDNFFNSSISTGGNARKPDLKNNTGMDISVFDIPNAGNSIIANGQSATRFRYGTDGDAYVIFNIVMAVESNESEVEGYHQVESVNGVPFDVNTSIKPGDELELVVEIRNRGGVPLENAELIVHLPDGFEYKNSKADYYFTPNSAATPVLASLPEGKVIQWKIGDVPIGNSPDELLGKLTYVVKVAERCELYVDTCSANFTLDGYINGDNSVTGGAISTTPLLIGYNEEVACVNAPIYGPIDFWADGNDLLKSSCGYDVEAAEIAVCVDAGSTEISFDKLSGIFPQGSRFFDSYPVVESTTEFYEESGFPRDYEGKYFAVLPGSTCIKEFAFSEIQIQADWEVSPSDCETVESEREVTLLVTTGIAPFEFFWDDETSSSNEITRSVTPGLHKVLIRDVAGCEARIEFVVPEIESFALSATKNDSPDSCPEESNGGITLEMTSPSEGTYDIEVEGALNSGDEYRSSELGFEGREFELRGLLPGTYTALVTNKNGCSQFEYFEINESDASFLKVDFDYTSETLEAENVLHYDFPVLFENLSVGSAISTYQWDFGDGTTSSEQSPSHKFEAPGVYQVTLSVGNASGCLKEFSRELTIAGTRFLRMPSAFTPNGDGKNDFYFPVFSQLKSIKFWVFNRWGEIIFFSENLNDQGWNGMLQGEEAPNGTYVYRVEYLDDSDGGRKETKAGSFLLLK